MSDRETAEPLKLGLTGVCRNCGLGIVTHDFDWAGGIMWKHVDGFPECGRRYAEPTSANKEGGTL